MGETPVQQEENDEHSDVGVEYEYKCPACGATATILSDSHDQSGDFEELKVMLGCSNGHKTKEMFRVNDE